jgi:hypothetical protein
MCDNCEHQRKEECGTQLSKEQLGETPDRGVHVGIRFQLVREVARARAHDLLVKMLVAQAAHENPNNFEKSVQDY